jgi:hypothetical protein
MQIDLEKISNFGKSVEPIIFLIIGGGVTYFFNLKMNARLEKIRSKQQKEIWRKQFDIFQSEPLVDLFKQIIIKIESTYFSEKEIDQPIINKLKAEITLVRFLDKKSKKEIEELYSLCLEYNSHLKTIIFGYQNTSSDADETIENKEQESNISDPREELIRKNICNKITKIVETIRIKYSETS